MGKLIRLELFNFKSYKGHHVLLFGDSYFTSIIGPNGSGKSNSMDAISFVLGIKSSHLRSAQLRDLVYRGRVLKTSKINDDGSAVDPTANGLANGDGEGSDEESQSQKPARNDPKSAWVMAVYEDDQGEEQKWKRSITNQGASEYRINDRVVTAQAYNDALESENILIKARNFLVFQGDVEAIASQSPKDLTRLIEQISGSLEYKAEYERLQDEAEKAADEQNYSLHRRRGINSEIKQYQEQKKEAEAFQKKAVEKDDAIIEHILWKLYHFQRVMDESSASIQEHQENLKEYRRGVEKYQNNLDAARAEQAKVSKDASRIERNIKRKEKELEEKEVELVPFDEKIKTVTSQIEMLRRKSAFIATERDDKSGKIAKLKKDLALVEKAQKQFEVQWQETLKNQGKQLSDDDFKEYQKLKSEVVKKTSEDQAKLDNLVRQLKTDEVTANSLKGKMEAAQASVEKLQSELDTSMRRRDNLKESISETIRDRNAKREEHNSLRSERVRHNQLKTDLEEKLQEILKQIKEGEYGRREGEKERRVKETITEMKRIFPGVKGRIGDLCKPKQKKFEEAVSTALGRDFDSIVVDTEKTGTECVQWLKDRKKSPMTFIPLDNIKVNATNSSLKGLAKARLTIDTIDFDSSVERAMSYACGSSIVCDDIATAKDICYRKKLQVKAVTLDGVMIAKAGNITGGRVPEGRGNKRAFGDAEMDKLRALEEKYTREIRALDANKKRTGEEEQLTNAINNLHQKVTYEQNELVEFEKNIASEQKKLNHEQRQLEDVEPKYEEKSAELEKSRRKVEEFQRAIAKVADKIFSNFCKRTEYSNIRDYEAQQGSLEQEALEKKNEFEKQKQTLKSQVAWEENHLLEIKTRLASLENNIEKFESDIEEYEAGKEKLAQAMDEDQAAVTELEDALQKQKEKLAAKTDKVNVARHDLQKASKGIDERTKSITTLETVAQRTSANRYALLRRCKMEQIAVPLAAGSKSLDSLPANESLQQEDPDAMDVDEGDQAPEEIINDYGIDVDFDGLSDDLKNPDDEDVEEQLQEKISTLNSELEKLNPNMRAIERLDVVETRLRDTDKDFNAARDAAKATRDAFNEIKEKRYDRFNKAFAHISDQITHVYKDLTRSATFPLGGQAYLDIEDSDAPYLSGIKYHAMPPLKRFRDMEHLSGGEKTMAALALLFAVHSYQPSPFFVLDEVDAALDNANVEKIRNYIKEHAGPGMQFIVISLKTGLFQGSESLVGVFRDQEVNSSKTLTLDLRKYA
ncbi:Bcsmc1 [Botrytis cinerea B05.10]|uniref:Structural maintenance of chromosomes protein n=3 Tax=Botryotinia fuckeliana TaxID=40559 RepID=A0A384JWB6_BOTFB|nr:Bcsmc1 [Botrytis cinerea B05.10]ATZ54557.1 Bcsmc1 [Botrytis cinerea B05.10]EMR84947.1 putative smc1 protein [Botrytis cinerea BcDW1]